MPKQKKLEHNPNLGPTLGELLDVELNLKLNKQLDGKMKQWVSDAKKKGFFKDHADVPSSQTLGRYKQGGSYKRQSLELFCGYLKWGQFSLPPPPDCETECMKMVDHLCNESAKTFRERFQIRGLNARPLSSDEIAEFVRRGLQCVAAARTVIDGYLALMEERPAALGGAFSSVEEESGAETTSIDKAAEKAASEVFDEHEYHVEGEERLKRLPERIIKAQQFPGWNNRRCVLLDMLDGTELAALGVDLWCSAVTLYDHERYEIIGAIIAFPSGKIIVGQKGEDYAWVAKQPGKKGDTAKADKLGGHSKLENLEKAHIAFYGQKPSRLLATATNGGFLNLLRNAGPRSKIRIYNFAGNPQITRLVDRKKSANDILEDAGVDIVFEVLGQLPHDFVPAAFIALKMKAYMCDLDGNQITEADLGYYLENPLKRRSYIIASTKALSDEFRTKIAVSETTGSAGQSG